MPTEVSPMITDAVTQANVTTLGNSPSAAMASLYQAAARSTGILFENAVAAQQQANTAYQAASNQGVALLYGLDTTGAAAPPKALGDEP
jgi:hypothetical protein